MKNVFAIFLGVAFYFNSVFAWAETPRFERRKGDANDWIVIDNTTHLEWQGCPLGLTGQNCTDGELRRITWQDALESCKNLGYGGQGDWRLPNRRELFSIVSTVRDNPAIDTFNFPKTPLYIFWSSSSDADDPSVAWHVDFSNMNVDHSAKGSRIYVRCVRGGQ